MFYQNNPSWSLKQDYFSYRFIIFICIPTSKMRFVLLVFLQCKNETVQKVYYTHKIYKSLLYILRVFLTNIE